MRLRLSEFSISLDDNGGLQSSPVEVSVSIDMYLYWLEIALAHLDASEAAHIELVSAWDSGDADRTSPPLEAEFAAAMQCITAAVIALDSFYAVARDHVPVSAEEILVWRNNRTSRPKQIAEVLRRGFLMGPESFAELRARLIEVFKWRDWSVHPPAGYDKPVRYDELHVGMEWRFVAFRYANALSVAGLALGLIAQLVTKPRSSNESLAEHCQSMLALITPLVERWEERHGELYVREASGDPVSESPA
jgi:hypothetical protein